MGNEQGIEARMAEWDCTMVHNYEQQAWQEGKSIMLALLAERNAVLKRLEEAERILRIIAKPALGGKTQQHMAQAYFCEGDTAYRTTTPASEGK